MMFGFQIYAANNVFLTVLELPAYSLKSYFSCSKEILGSL
jgi:hypothetical protein